MHEVAKHLDAPRTPLWQKLETMRIEPEGAVLTFAARLARENGWSRAYAEAVVREYKRFLYLAGGSPQPVTPSDEVDQAWHLHLAYSRHYWGVLCRDILKRPFHHGPTEGGEAERVRYQCQYESTLERYRAVFGAEPPPSIWPNADVRFSARSLRIDLARHWLVPKALAGRFMLAAATAMVAACSAVTGGGGEWEIALGIMIILLLSMVIVFAFLGAERWDEDSNRNGGSCGGGGGVGGDGDSGCSGAGCGGCGG